MSLAVTVCAVAASAPVLANNVPCATVLRKLQQVERGGDTRGADPRRVAISLGTSVAWVERCATVHGRRLRLGPEERRSREVFDPRWESDEPEETAREELETEGDVAFRPNPYKDKVRQREFLRNEREWQPFEKQPWEPHTGYAWEPFVDDPLRMYRDDGMGRAPRPEAVPRLDRAPQP